MKLERRGVIEFVSFVFGSGIGFFSGFFLGRLIRNRQILERDGRILVRIAL